MVAARNGVNNILESNFSDCLKVFDSYHLNAGLGGRIFKISDRLIVHRKCTVVGEAVCAADINVNGVC